MRMYFKTLKTSETGMKLEEIFKRADEARLEVVKLANEYGFEEWKASHWGAFGGCTFVQKFNKPVDFSIWKENKDGMCSPRKSTKKGKELAKKLEELTIVPREDLNKCIGYDSMFGKIGITARNKEYFLFVVMEDWHVAIPSDCEEITLTEHKKLSKKN